MSTQSGQNNDNANEATGGGNFDSPPVPGATAAAAAAQAPSAKELESKPRPTRPLSAYNLFFQAERKNMLDVLPVRAKGKPRHRYVLCLLANRRNSSANHTTKNISRAYMPFSFVSKATGKLDLRILQERLRPSGRPSPRKTGSPLILRLQQKRNAMPRSSRCGNENKKKPNKPCGVNTS